MTDEKNNAPGSSGKGFSGFGDLVSDVSKEIESVTRESSNPPTPQSEATASSTSSAQHTTAQTESPRVNKPPVPPLPPSDSSGGKWLWGIGIVVVVLIAIGNSGKNESQPYTPPPSYEPTPTSISPDPIAPPTVATTVSTRKEDMPSVGNGLVFSQEQIRYCLSQKIRIDAIEKIADASKSSEVDTFNTMVGDYNSRCSHFKYRRGLLESVRAEVNSEQAAIEAAAQHSWVRESLGLESPLKVKKDKQKQSRSGTQPRRAAEEQKTTAPGDGGIKISKNRENYKTCIGGDYPTLCKHSLLTMDEGKQVAAAERRENYKTCIGGDYPTLCKHSLLTTDEGKQVAAAEKREKNK